MDILITVSGFASTPSLSLVVASHFGMRDDVKCYSLSGHGCSGGLIGIELAQELLSARPHACLASKYCHQWSLYPAYGLMA